MDARKVLDVMLIAERLKDTTRHCYTAENKKESVAEHSWMAALMAFFLRDEFPQTDMDKVIKMCIIHDLGECFTGDIPVFEKNESHEKREKKLLYDWVGSLPEDYSSEMLKLYDEMEKLETTEAKVYKAIDSMEALIQHNISPIATWLPEEYDMNLTYGYDKVGFSDYMKKLREAIREDTIKKIDEGK